MPSPDRDPRRSRPTPRLILIVALCALAVAPAVGGRVDTPEERLAEAERFGAEQSYRSAIEICREVVEALEGDARGRCVALWARCAARLNEADELRALYEREIDRTPFPHSARLAHEEGVRRSQGWGGWDKLAPLERALAEWERGGEDHDDDWCTTAFALIEGLSLSWQYDMPASEWEKEDVPEDPEERRRAYEEWQRARGIAEDRRRWERTENLFGGILELASEDDARARALLERGMRRIIAHGEFPGLDPLRGLDVEDLVERVRSIEGGASDARAMEEWRLAVRDSIADWRRLADEHRFDSRADDALYLIAWVTETHLGDLVDAKAEYANVISRYPESQWTSDSHERIEEIEREGLSLVESVSIASPGTATTLKIEARNAPRIDVSVWSVASYLDRVEAQHGLEPEPARLAGGPPLHTFSVETGCTDDHKAKFVTVTLPVSGAGAYRVRVAGRSSAIDIPIFHSGLALHVEGGSDDALAWLTSGSDGRPVADAEVLLRLDIRRRSNERRHWTTRLRTDARGLVRWSYPERFIPLLEQGWRLDRLAAVATLGAEVSPAPDFRPQFDSGRRPRLHYYLETDRPVFRPGQTAAYKVTFRHWNGEEYVDPESGLTPTIRFLDPQGSPLLERTATVDVGGALSGEIELGREMTLGMCTLVVEVAGDAVPPRSWQRSAFRVEEYRLPEFEVSVDAPDRPVLYGDPLTITVEGRFLSGEPVRGGKVRVRVQRSPFHFSYAPPSPYPWRKQTESPYRYWSREDVFSGDAELDGEGVAEFEVPTMERGDDLDSTYVVEAWLTDASQREETTTVSFPVTRTALFAHLDPEPLMVAPGEPMEVMVRVMDARERSRSAAGTMEIARRVDREEMKDGELVPVTDWEPVRSVEFRAEEGGSAFSEVASEEGEFRLTFRSEDGRGNAFEGSCRLWVVGPGFTGRDYTLEGLQVVTSTPVARIGGSARIAVLTERKDATILVLRSAAGRILGLDVIEANGQVGQLEFPVEVAESPNFFVTVWAVWDGTMHRAQTSVAVPPDPYFLSGVLSVDATEVLPGADVALDLVLTDAKGNPVEGRWSLTLFDRAVLAIQPEITESPMQHFHERQWGHTMRGESSLGWRSRQHFEWFSGSEPIDRPNHPLPDLLRRTWQRRFGYLQASFFPRAGVLRQVGQGLGYYGLELGDGADFDAPETDSFFGGEYAESEVAMDASGGMVPAPAARAGRARMAEGKMGAANEASPGDWGADDAGGAGAELAPVRIRQNFSATAAWEPNFTTDTDGRGTLSVTMPDTLTEWRGIARGIDGRGRTFEARVEVRTRRNIRLRLATPRFLREGDDVVLSLVGSNQFTDEVAGSVVLDFPAGILAYRGTSSVEIDEDRARGSIRLPMELPAEGEATIDLPFSVTGTGEATFLAILATPRESDGLDRRLPVLPYGLDRYIGAAGVAGDADGTSTDGWDFAVPERSDAASRSLVVDLTPSPAIALIESLPYLVRYPYGCVEQTLNRFIPAVVVAKTLEGTGVDLAEILPERPEEMPVGFWGHLEARPLELFRPEDLDHLLSVGVGRLREAQNGDGSWGWWRGYDGDPYITALVVEHLCTAHELGIPVDTSMLLSGLRWLRNHAIARDLEGELDIYERPGLEELVWVTRALLHAGHLELIPIDDDESGLHTLLDFLHRNREPLGAQGKALLALSLADSDRPEDHERARVLIRNLYDTQGGEDRFGTVHFGREGALRWYDHGVESTAWALRALVRIVPDDPRITRVVRWLLESRAGSHYDSTRSTATVALALTDYLQRTGELDCDLQAEVSIDGTVVGTFAVDRSTLFTTRGRIEVPAAMLEAGEHRLEIRRSGRGPLHWSAGLEFYSREDPVPAGGNRVEIARQAYLLTDVKRPRKIEEVIDGKPVIRTIEEWHRERAPLREGSIVAPGDRVLVEISVNSANDFRYVVLENPKPAGFETVAVQSGYIGGVYGYRELRDDRTAWFASRLPEGESMITIELRAERPGRYRTVPATIEAMYLPHVRGNSTSGAISVEAP